MAHCGQARNELDTLNALSTLLRGEFLFLLTDWEKGRETFRFLLAWEAPLSGYGDLRGYSGGLARMAGMPLAGAAGDEEGKSGPGPS